MTTRKRDVSGKIPEKQPYLASKADVINPTPSELVILKKITSILAMPHCAKRLLYARITLGGYSQCVILLYGSITLKHQHSIRKIILGTDQRADKGSSCKYICYLFFGFLIIFAVVLYLLPSQIDPVAYKYVYAK